MADGPVVSNTSPLIKLSGVGLLDLLPQIYGEVWIPEAVHDEYRVGAAPTDPDVSQLTWIRIEAVVPDASLLAITQLGAGEVAAISLAITTSARAVLLDDRQARKVAASRGLPVVGTLAVLVRAKSAGLIPLVRPIVDQMIAQGRRISPGLRAQVLRDVGEGTL